MPEQAGRLAALGRLARPAFEVRGRAIRLEVPAPGTAPTWPRWIQIAAEGLYLGHPSGPFEFNAEVFEQIIENFRSLPEYKPGAAPIEGVPGVIQYDWRHASEKSPMDGGADAMAAQAAKGWIWDLDVRKLEDGTLGLFAWSAMLEPAKSLIDQGKIAWTSVCVWPNETDRNTGDKIGCYLSSVALTNDPFIRGMVPLQIAAEAHRYVDFYDLPKSAGELVEALRALFGLPVQAPLADVLRELLTLRTYAAGELPAPAGVDVVCLVGALRRLFNLPTIASAAEVFAACDKLLGAVAAEEALEEAVEPPSSKLPPLTAAARRARKETPVKIEELLPFLAGRLGCAATPDAVSIAFPLALEKAEKDAKSAKDKLTPLLSALGVEDPDAAMQKIGATLKMSQELLEAMPELAEMYEAEAEAEDGAAEEDMEMVAATALRGLPQDVAQDALRGFLMARTGGVELVRLKGADGKIDSKALLDPSKRRALFASLRARRDARAKFRERHGLDGKGAQQRPPAGPPAHQTHLFQRYAALSNGNNDGGAIGLMRGAQMGHAFAPARGTAPQPDQEAPVLDLSDEGGLPGNTDIDRALFVVQRDKLAERPGDFDNEHATACQLAYQWRQTIQGAQASHFGRF